MKNQKSKKSKARRPNKVLAALEAGAEILAAPLLGVRTVDRPPAELLLEQAEQEPNYSDLDEYTVVIAALRTKGFSYRDIAAWLCERGVEVSHNTVYRLYIQSLHPLDAEVEERETALEEQVREQR